MTLKWPKRSIDTSSPMITAGACGARTSAMAAAQSALMALWSVATMVSSPSARLDATRSASDTAESADGAACWWGSKQRQPKASTARRSVTCTVAVSPGPMSARCSSIVYCGPRDTTTRYEPGGSATSPSPRALTTMLLPSARERRPEVRIARRRDAEEAQPRRQRRAVLAHVVGERAALAT